MEDLRQRLSRLGVIKGDAWKIGQQPAAVAPASIESLIEGQVREGKSGACFDVVRAFAPEMLQGELPLASWLALDTAVIARMGNLAPTSPIDTRRFVFLDTETTGLGGVATLPFMVGLGFFNTSDDFEIHQLFLRSPSEEAALLDAIHDIVGQDGGLVTFNGRSFDVPLLLNRYILARRSTHLGSLPNLDLLPPARRLWKRRLPSCALGALERDILGIPRTSEDIPGWLIPTLYQQYLQTGNAREMLRVFYHNEQDILSMVVLAARLTSTFGRPDIAELPADDRLSMARWYESRGLLAECEAAYRAALDEISETSLRQEALTGLAGLLKRSDRRSEAVQLWEYLADLRQDTTGHEELAKYYEWHDVDLPQALRWTEQGISLAEAWRPGLQRTEALCVLKRRHERLVRKITNRAQSSPDEPDPQPSAGM
ncbi:MAG: ribonuclease H-like domain-containing protein [Anaerolineae bacterium]|nr:ribonuclease H-like domain-containing protein [Anaerolineae bacterium]